MSDAPDLAATWEDIDSLALWEKNPRVNDGEPVEAVAASITRFGWGAPIVAQKSTRRVIAGHTRLKAAQSLGHTKVPVRFVDLNDGEATALTLADNRIGELAEWDDAGLSAILKEMEADEIDLDGLGWDEAGLAELLKSVEVEAHNRKPPGDDAPEVQAKVYSVRGEVYELGPHRLMCGDSTEPEEVARLMGGALALLWHADPPYGMGKENDGVANDNLYRDKLDAFLLSAWQAWRPHLTDNASAYMWGSAEGLWRWWWLRMQGGEALTIRNEIVWDKKTAGAGGISHMGAEGFRSYPNGSERCLFWMLGEQGFGSVNAADYWEGWEPIRSYLAGEVNRMGWGPGDIKRICGVGMYSHWFSKSQWTMIPEHHYAALQEDAKGNAFMRPYDSARADYDGLMLSGEHSAARAEFNASRAFFDNTHDTMRDVWEFPRVKGEERQGHATPKPVAMMERAVRSSAPEGALVVEPFGGSGSTLMGCAASGRVCYTMELLPQWVDVIRRRWTTYALDNNIDPGAGALAMNP